MLGKSPTLSGHKDGFCPHQSRLRQAAGGFWLLTGMGKGRMESSGLADASYFIYRLDKQQSSNCIAQGTIFNILRETIMEKNVCVCVCMCVYKSITLSNSRN